MVSIMPMSGSSEALDQGEERPGEPETDRHDQERDDVHRDSPLRRKPPMSRTITQRVYFENSIRAKPQGPAHQKRAKDPRRRPTRGLPPLKIRHGIVPETRLAGWKPTTS